MPTWKIQALSPKTTFSKDLNMNNWKEWTLLPNHPQKCKFSEGMYGKRLHSKERTAHPSKRKIRKSSSQPPNGRGYVDSQVSNEIDQYIVVSPSPFRIGVFAWYIPAWGKKVPLFIQSLIPITTSMIKQIGTFSVAKRIQEYLDPLQPLLGVIIHQVARLICFYSTKIGWKTSVENGLQLLKLRKKMCHSSVGSPAKSPVFWDVIVVWWIASYPFLQDFKFQQGTSNITK